MVSPSVAIFAFENSDFVETLAFPLLSNSGRRKISCGSWLWKETRGMLYLFYVLTFRILHFRGVHSNIDLELSLISGDKRRSEIQAHAHAQVHARYSEGTRRESSGEMCFHRSSLVREVQS